MRDVSAGWLLRYTHTTGASFFFFVTYIHIFRGLYYGSYKAPRELVWMLGLVIYLLMMATAFMGYVLPWGQMSYWGAQVITGFFSAFPLVGEPIRIWLLGGYAPDQAALTRFFSLHYLLPFVIAAVVILHIWALHIPGSGNPTGVDVKDERDTLPFHPFYTAKDGWFAGLVLLIFFVVVYFAPNALLSPDNSIPANPLATPAHIVPEWYFWPFYAILRSFTVDFILAGQAVGRAGDVHVDPAALLPAVARQVAGAFGQLSAGVQALLLAAGARRPDPRLCRRSADQPVPDRARPGRGGLLFHPFPRDPAVGLGVRDSAAAADVDQRIRASRGGSGGSAGRADSNARRLGRNGNGRVRGQAGTWSVHRFSSSAWSSPGSC